MKIRTRDNLMTLDAAQIHSATVFLLGELERLDPRINEPLQRFTWGRDLPIRSDVSLADEVSSFTRDFFASPGNQRADGKHFIGSNTTQIAGVQARRELYRQPLLPWGIEINYSIFDLVRSQALGRPIDQTKISAVQRIYQGEMDEIAYIGDPTLDVTGLVNNEDVVISPAGTKSGGGTAWTINTDAHEILEDMNRLIADVSDSTNDTVTPTKILMPTNQYRMIATRRLGEIDHITILKFLKDNNASNDVSGQMLDIYPCKWLDEAGTAGTSRMVAYAQNEEFIRIPVVGLLRTPLHEEGMFFNFHYYTAVAGVEIVYPETIGYMDGI